MTYTATLIAPRTFRVAPNRALTNIRPIGLDRALAKLKRRGVQVERFGISGHAQITLPLVMRNEGDTDAITAEDMTYFLNHQ